MQEMIPVKKGTSGSLKLSCRSTSWALMERKQGKRKRKKEMEGVTGGGEMEGSNHSERWHGP